MLNFVELTMLCVSNVIETTCAGIGKCITFHQSEFSKVTETFTSAVSKKIFGKTVSGA